jgi:hypothetical protein
MSGCIGCDDNMSYEVQSDGTVILRIVRDGIESTERTTMQALGLNHSGLSGLALHNAMQPALRRLQKKRDASDRA